MTDLTPENWEQVKALFEEALECAPEARAAFVEEHAIDPAVRDEVLRLLGEHDLAGSFLSSPIHTEFSAGNQGRLTPGELLDGKFKIIELIAEGGMGQVWLAEQTIPLQRQVVVKLIRAGLFDEGLLQRFQAERQSLAMMDHPSIAKVFDAGATQAGQPYFVMEYVPGLSITKYCDENKLSIGDRLELFIKVCEGVQHAHQKAIIHRDLKPANILIVEVDGKPVPRIIDFGIAKATTPLRGEGEFTQAGGFVGTPGYMSPEQTDARVADVDTRSDVYSLGAILYVLLAGSLPFDPKEWKEQPLDEMLRRMREDDPPRPSTKVSTGRETVATAEARATDVKRLVGLLRGDLDWITMKALEKDRGRRYGTPTELAADIRRHLNNEPVQAGPANTGYRLRKYVRRHRIGVAVGAGVALLLAGFGVLQAVQLRRTVRERDRANRITDFMTGMFKVSDPSEARGNSITAREILDKASKDIDTGLAKDPEIQAQMMNTMGTVYINLGIYPRAESLFKQAIEIELRFVGPDNQLTLRSKHNLAIVFSKEGHLPEAEKLDRETLAAMMRDLGYVDRLTLMSENNLADVLIAEGQYKEAEKLEREALDGRRRFLGPEHPDTIGSMNELGIVLYREGRYPDAEGWHRNALDISRRILGTEDLTTMQLMTSLAIDLYTEGKFVEAEKMNREVLQLSIHILGPDHSDTLTSMNELAGDLFGEKRYAEAEVLYRQTFEARRRVLGSEHPLTLASMINLASVLGIEGRLAESEELFREDLDLHRRLLGPEHPETMLLMGNLAETLGAEHRFAEAENLLRKAIDMQSRVIGPNHPDTAISIYQLAIVVASEGRRNDAFQFIRSAIDHGLPSYAVSGISEDTDLQSLHGDPKFDALLAYAKQHAAAASPK